MNLNRFFESINPAWELSKKIVEQLFSLFILS